MKQIGNIVVTTYSSALVFGFRTQAVIIAVEETMESRPRRYLVLFPFMARPEWRAESELEDWNAEAEMRFRERERPIKIEGEI